MVEELGRDGHGAASLRACGVISDMRTPRSLLSLASTAEDKHDSNEGQKDTHSTAHQPSNESDVPLLRRRERTLVHAVGFRLLLGQWHLKAVVVVVQIPPIGRVIERFGKFAVKVVRGNV